MVEEEEPGTARTLPILCPECKDRLPDQRELAVHLERHREVKAPVTDPRTGETVSRACSMGCGRHFVRPSEYREHNPLCDGSKPLWQPPGGDAARVMAELAEQERRRKEVGMVNCKKCGKEFKDGRGLAAHRRGGACGGGGAAKRPRRKARGRAAPRAGAKSGVGEILRKQAKEQRERAAEHMAKADKLEAMAADLDSLLE